MQQGEDTGEPVTDMVKCTGHAPVGEGGGTRFLHLASWDLSIPG